MTSWREQKMRYDGKYALGACAVLAATLMSAGILLVVLGAYDSATTPRMDHTVRTCRVLNTSCTDPASWLWHVLVDGNQTGIVSAREPACTVTDGHPIGTNATCWRIIDAEYAFSWQLARDDTGTLCMTMGVAIVLVAAIGVTLIYASHDRCHPGILYYTV
jgi:hypothetical protein